MFEKNAEKPRAVIDTNLILSGAFAKSNSTPAKLIDAWRDKKYVLVTSVPLLVEIEDVLNRKNIRKHFSLTAVATEKIMEELTAKAFIVPGTLELTIIHDDPDDNDVLSAAVEGMATHIVTGDTKHLLPLEKYNDTLIVTARNFLASL